MTEVKIPYLSSNENIRMQSIAGEKPHTTNNANHLSKGKKESRTYWHWSRTFIVQYLYKVLVGRVGRTAVQNQHVIPSKGCQNAASPISTLGRLWRECQGFFLLYLLEFYNIQKFIEKKAVLNSLILPNITREFKEVMVRSSPDLSRKRPSKQVKGITVSACANRSLAFS